MEFRITLTLKRKLAKIKKKDFHLSQKIQIKLKLFQKDYKHPSLRLHKLKGRLENTWSISITGDVRMHYLVENGIATFFDIGTHDELYK